MNRRNLLKTLAAAPAAYYLSQWGMPDGTFQDILDCDSGGMGNRWGYLSNDHAFCIQNLYSYSEETWVFDDNFIRVIEGRSWIKDGVET